MGTLRERANRLRDQIWKEAPPAPVEDRDWSALAERAESLLRFLNQWAGPLPLPIIRALTVVETRSRLEEAVGRSKAARGQGFDDSWVFLTELFDSSQEMSTGITRTSPAAQGEAGRIGAGVLPPGPLKANQVHNLYLLVEVPEGVLVTDQHALHERILFE